MKAYVIVCGIALTALNGVLLVFSRPAIAVDSKAAALQSAEFSGGSWRRQNPQVPFLYFKVNPPPFNASSQLKIEAITEGLKAGTDLSAPGLYCQPFSFVGDNGGLLDTFEFLITPGRVTLINEMGLVRRIFTDGRKVPSSALETNAGYSVGHWEGKTLIVETIALDSDARFPVEQFAGAPAIGKNARVTERMFLVAPDVLEIDSILTAPELLTAPYHTRFKYQRDSRHTPTGISFCVHNDRSIDPVTGHQRLDLTPPPDLPPPPRN